MSAAEDGRLAPARALELEAHLAACASCRGKAAALREALNALSAMPALEPESGGWERLAARLQAEAQSAPARRSVPALRFVLVGAAISLAALVLMHRPPDVVRQTPRGARNGRTTVTTIARPPAPPAARIAQAPTVTRSSAPVESRSPKQRIVHRQHIAPKHISPSAAPSQAPKMVANNSAAETARFEEPETVSGNMTDLLSEGFTLLVEAHEKCPDCKESQL